YQSIAPRSETILTPDKANAVYVAGYGFSMRDDDSDYPAVAIGGYMLGGGFSASPLDNDASFHASMIYNPQNVEKLEIAFREEIERAARDGFSTEELERAKTGWLKSRQVSRASDASLAGTLSSYLF